MVDVVSLAERSRWESEHRLGGLPSQSWHYAWSLSAEGLDPKLGIVAAHGSRMLIPYFERHWRGTTDIASLPGLSGASLASGTVLPIEPWSAHARERHWVAGYMQLTPLMDPILPPNSNLLARNDVYFLDIEDVDFFKSAARIVTRKIRAATLAGVTLVDDRRALTAALIDLYPASMARLGAHDRYRFSAETLSRWVSDPTSVVIGAAVGGAIVAVTVFLVAGKEAEHHIIATTARGREFSAWVIWQATIKLREKGVARVNLGGGAVPGDGVAAFKERLGAIPRQMFALCHVYDLTTYAKLCSAASISGTETRFPAYRGAAR